MLPSACGDQQSVEELVAYSLAKPGAEESYPWGDEELVANDKGFAVIGLGSGTVGLKCGAGQGQAGEWRNRFPDAITVSAYVGRYGWNSVDTG